jgi:hypothetical protein
LTALALRLAALVAAPLAAAAVVAAPLTNDELREACAGAEGNAQCARRVETIQLKRLPNLAVREGTALKVSLYPAGSTTFEDTDALNGGKTYALWDFLNEINAVLLFATDGGNASFVLLLRTNGRRVDLPTEPKLSPDRTRLATADFCASSCIDELAIWRITREGVAKELSWKPAERWTDAGVAWKGPDVVVVDYTRAGSTTPWTLERRLSAPDWRRHGTP